MNQRADSGIALEDVTNDESLQQKTDPSVCSNAAAAKPDPDEDKFYAGLGLVLDYLNQGNGEVHLRGLCRAAEHWCLAYFGAACFFPPGVPQAVLDVHPKLFDLRIPSYERLDAGSPPQDDGDPSASSSSSASADDDFRLPPSIEDPDIGMASPTCESFPAYMEPVFIPDEAVYRIMARYDAEHQPIEAARREQLAQHMYDEQRAHDAAAAPPRRALPFEIRITAADLIGSPLIFFVPAVLMHMARGLVVSNTANIYACFVKEKERLVAQKEEELAKKKQLLLQLQQQQDEEAIGVPEPQCSLQSPICFERTTAVKRERSNSESDEDARSHKRGDKWAVLTNLIPR